MMEKVTFGYAERKDVPLILEFSCIIIWEYGLMKPREQSII